MTVMTVTDLAVDVLVALAIALLAAQSVAFLWGLALLRTMQRDQRAGRGLLRILIVISAMNVLTQGLTLWRAILIAVDAEGTLELRIANFIIVELISGLTLIWAMWRSSSLTSGDADDATE